MQLSKASNGEFELFVPLTKINEATGEFEAWATIEEIDQSGEIIDIDKSWPYFEALADRFSKATEGANFGPLREQHDPNKASGHLIAPPTIKTHESGARGIYINGLVTDDGTRKKLNAKTLTGVSIGGNYVGDVEKVKIDGRDAKKFVANPNHYGVVDSPCVKNALVTIVKADGSETKEPLGFAPSQFWSCRGGNDHGHITKADARSCDGSKPVQKTAEAEVKKSLYGLSRLACILADLLSVRSDAEYEEVWAALAGDPINAEVTDRLTAAAQALFDALEAVLADERAELEGDTGVGSEAAATVTDYSPMFDMAALGGAMKKSATAKQLIKALRAEKSKTFNKGDRVDASGHSMPGMDVMTGEISIVRNGAYYAITFDEPMKGMDQPHKWVSGDEMTLITDKKSSTTKSLRVPPSNGSSSTQEDIVEKKVEDKKTETPAAPVPAKATGDGELSKGATDAITKAVGDGLTKALEPITAKVDGIATAQKASDDKQKTIEDNVTKLSKVVAFFANKPAESRAVKRVTKADDGAGEGVDHGKAPDKPDNSTAALMAKAIANPIPVSGTGSGLMRE